MRELHCSTNSFCEFQVIFRARPSHANNSGRHCLVHTLRSDLLHYIEGCTAASRLLLRVLVSGCGGVAAKHWAMACDLLVVVRACVTRVHVHAQRSVTQQPSMGICPVGIRRE